MTLDVLTLQQNDQNVWLQLMLDGTCLPHIPT